MFVEDCDLWTAPAGDSSDTALVSTFTKAAQAWGCLLFASEGFLALHKCYWWFITWDWCNGLPVLRDPGVDELQVCLAAGTNEETVPIKRLALGEVIVGLGFRLAPSDGQQQEICHRLLTSESMAAKLNVVPLTPSEAWTFYIAIYRPKLFYPPKSWRS